MFKKKGQAKFYALCTKTTKSGRIRPPASPM